MPTLTPLPTHLFPESSLEIEYLLANNGGCLLPCFWGMTPGKTTRAELEQFINQFPVEASWMGDEYVFYYAHRESADTTFSVRFSVENELVQMISPDSETTRLSFPLTRLFTRYGPPEKILLGQSGTFYSKDELFYDLIILYETQQIAASDLLFTREHGNYICYDPDNGIRLIMWADGKNWKNYFNPAEIPVTSLEQVTNYDIESFYKQFSTKNRTICMKTLLNNP